MPQEEQITQHEWVSVDSPPNELLHYNECKHCKTVMIITDGRPVYKIQGAIGLSIFLPKCITRKITEDESLQS